LGGGWDETMWPVKTLPSRWDLDEVSGGHPVFWIVWMGTWLWPILVLSS